MVINEKASYTSGKYSREVLSYKGYLVLCGPQGSGFLSGVGLNKGRDFDHFGLK